MKFGPFESIPGAMMRALTATAVLTFFLSASIADAQVRRMTEGIRRPDGSTQFRRTESIRRPTASGGLGHHGGHHHGGYGHGGHEHGGHGHGAVGGYYGGYGGVYGFGYGLDSVGIYGNGLGYYRGPATWGGINPPVFTYPPYSYGGYGYSLPPRYGDTAYYLGQRNTYGLGTAWSPVGQSYNSVLEQQRYEADWSRLSAELADRALRNVDGPVPGANTILVPSTPEAKIKSARYEAIGDENFANQDFSRAYTNYKTAAGITKDNAALLLKTGYAAAAIARFSTAIEYFRRAVAVDPAIATYGPTPGDLYGDNQIAWTTHLGRVTRWVAEDVRDANRVFLLGTLLLFDGDTRATEFLEKAWQLSGGADPSVVALLSPPRDAVDGPADDVDQPVDPALGAAPAAVAGPSLVAPAGEGDPPFEAIPPAPGDRQRSERPYGETPLFPLPSEQAAEPDVLVPPAPQE